MHETVIKVDNLGKLYRIGAREKYYTLRDSLHNAAVSLAKKLRPGRKAVSRENTIWALKNVNFEVSKGEVVGVIGRNGSGKSTLLKLLSRITFPTEGYADVQGSVASLLEIGTGFHPELTGRDNIFLNGAILGMRKFEIRKKFDDIVSFAEVGKFIDTPLKFYSSGMYMRLAFAVAAYLEADILFVDEVLAVGDLAYQKKCLGKLDDVAKGGRTVLFVTHQMNQVRRLCQRTLWFENGHVRGFGPTSEVVGAYESSIGNISLEQHRANDGQPYQAKFLKWEIRQPGEAPGHSITTTGPVQAVFYVNLQKHFPHGDFGFSLCNSDGQIVWGAGVSLEAGPGLHTLTLSLPMLPLRPGFYYWIASFFSEKEPVDVWQCYPQLLISTMPMASVFDQYAGMLNLPFGFEVKQIEG